MLARSIALVAVALLLWPGVAGAAESPGVQIAERALEAGKLADGVRELNAHLKKSPQDDDARFALGIVEFVQSVEHLSQSLYRYGLKTQSRPFVSIPFLRLPIPQNPKPEEVTCEDVRKILQTFLDDMQRVDDTLAKVKSTKVKVPINFGLIRLDLDGDGAADENETLSQIAAAVMGSGIGKQPDFVVAFDAGDVHWLRGYSHLLSAVAEIKLAYDSQELFDATAHLFFAKPKTPFPFLQNGKHVFESSGVDIADAIALVHLVHWPVKEPARMAAAREHLKAMTRESRESWKLILAETDDDREWIPNPKQKNCVVPGIVVSKAMVDAWHEFLDEFDRLLDGKVLLPFWRGTEEDVGVNLKRVFTEPKTLDLVLWVQGTGAAPFLEKGEVTKPDFWRRMMITFRGQFPGFALWFN